MGADESKILETDDDHRPALPPKPQPQLHQRQPQAAQRPLDDISIMADTSRARTQLRTPIGGNSVWNRSDESNGGIEEQFQTDVLTENGPANPAGFRFQETNLTEKQLAEFKSFSSQIQKEGIYRKQPGIIHLPPTLLVEEGKVYEGQYDSNTKKQHGIGRQEWVNRAYYKGEWKQGVRHGLGLYVCENGHLQFGTWHLDQQFKMFRKVYRNGDVYFGECSNGREDGKGTLMFANGDMYQGDFSNGIMTGLGTLERNKRKLINKGKFLDGQYHGNGTLEDHHGKYEGHCVHGQIDSQGKFTPKNPADDKNLD